jgi:hypothetical protein
VSIGGGGGGGVGGLPVTHAKVALAASVAEEGRKEAREEVIEDDQDEAAMISPGGRTGLLSVLWCTVCV